MTQQFSITVSPVGPKPGVLLENGVLTIVGTDRDDIVLIDHKAGNYIVWTNIAGHESTSFDTDQVDSIHVEVLAGNDFVLASHRVSVDMTAFGGSGNDILAGGRGDDSLYGELGNDILVGGHGDDFLNGGVGHDLILGGQHDDILVGGAGNDFLFGEAGRDVLMGGSGADLLSGGRGQDLLIANITNIDDDEAAIRELHETWTDSGSLKWRLREITASDLEILPDGAFDLVFGGPGRDAILNCLP